MNKFKVGDKVRVTGNDCAYQKGYVGIITRDDNDGTYQLDKKRLWIGYLKIEPVTPLTFDHSLALQGSPVYCNGVRVMPLYSPNHKIFIIHGLLADQGVWDNNGNYRSGDTYQHPLTTIPPEVYVEESRWVWVHPNNVVHMYEDHHDKKMWEHRGYQLCEVKIKVRK